VSEDGSLHPFVEMKTLDNSRLSAHVLEVDLSKTPVNPLALDVVNAYLQSDAKNSLDCRAESSRADHRPVTYLNRCWRQKLLHGDLIHD
jgi:hypothetical protein